VAEGDRFERACPTPWKRLYRLAKGGAAIPTLVDNVLPAIRETLKVTGGSQKLERSCDLVEQLAQATKEGPLIGWPDTVLQLSAELEREDRNELGILNSLCGRAFAIASLKVNRAATNGESLDAGAAFFDTFTDLLVDNQFFARTRIGLEQHHGRSDADEKAWEAELLAAVRPQSRKFYRTLQSLHRVPARSPQRSSTAKPMTLEDLNRPVPLMDDRNG
jgi:hypothetical protein